MDKKKLKELALSIGWDVQELYQELRTQAIEEMDMTNFVRILKDMKEIEQKNRMRYNIMFELLTDITASYEDIGARVGLGIGKQKRCLVYWHVKELSIAYPWIRELMVRKAMSYHHNKRNEIHE